ncbi:ABC-F family ATP-binding cassette domain-containing protein [Serpentinicella sp. ANB-PHB4]|uniref:ABC-F family ATP-binding cassette domain-containing protein n=1 Tax=Serpentinicella sp. ANB-PHB4 TaxID=3074076 RepID=UPI002866C691|nr:ABC-F family ATP-binding cassette domain-containing protein [Serpentinicella sp. ANB-PHB4]MDR5658794.1 ABC-F family ATP-binding cassette domain-containing protein [Serpentinicella sp. ANB-PHB4]
MNLLSAENISKSYSEKTLLNNVSFGINQGDKIGIIGINGTGKTTLLKITAEVEVPDAGRVIRNNNLVLEYLPQNPNFDLDATVLEQVFRSNSKLMGLIKEYTQLSQSGQASSDRMIKLTQEIDALGGWTLESEAKAVLTKLGITDFEAKIGALSGGQKKRVALASALVNPSELLILDEPTNHLDSDIIDWLEQYLNKRKGALLMITHDRYFLDRVVNRIIEIDKGNLYEYTGNYSEFLEKKFEREQMVAVHEKKRQDMYKKELAWIRKGAKARTTKQKARIERFEALQDGQVQTEDDRMNISVGSSRLGKKVIELHNITKTYDNKVVLNDFNYVVLRNDRVGIVGPNGSGKSTLMNIIKGDLKPSSGQVEVGETVKIGLYSQETYHMDDSLRVIDYIKEVAEYITTAEGDKITASQMLERFLFPSHMQWTFIEKLSGGEKRRLHLLRVLMGAPNVLLLDEPTNDLDTETLTILEDYIDEFPGAVITVSHDRYFLDKITEKIFAIEEKGKVKQYPGNYSDYQRMKKESEKITEQKNSNKKTTSNQSWKQEKEKPLKFTFKEQKEYDEIDDVIAEVEANLETHEQKINQAGADHVLLQQLTEEKEILEAQLDEKMQRWVYLNDLAEKIEQQRTK